MREALTELYHNQVGQFRTMVAREIVNCKHVGIQLSDLIQTISEMQPPELERLELSEDQKREAMKIWPTIPRPDFARVRRDLVDSAEGYYIRK
jgi:hypothetical protein